MKLTDKISFYSALFSAKLINKGLHLIKSPGTSLPGYIAMKISKNFMSFLSNHFKKNIITVTGTNGKTTTSGLLAHILKTNQDKVLHNEKGANMLSGIATSLAIGYKPFSSLDYAVLETDEVYLTKLYDFLKVDYLVLTNLFHDQLDRYGDLDTTAKKIQEAVEKNPDLKIFVNADDPTLLEIGKNNKKIFFGFEDITYKTSVKEPVSPVEEITCKCSSTLKYEKRYYAHIGKYFCENCGKKRPELDYKGYAVIYDDYFEIYVKYQKDEKEVCFKSNLIGLYNTYNALGAICAALEMGVSPDIIQKALDSYQVVFGRSQKISVDEKDILIQLIKNPTGASEVLRTVNEKVSKKILIALNDNFADGRDMSWLWDTDFELLKNYPFEIVVSGIRAYDVATRMKYAGFDVSKIVVKNEVKDALDYCLNTINQGEQLLIMPSYTVLLEIEKILK